MTTVSTAAGQHRYRARVGSGIMTLDGARRSCLTFTAVEPTDPATPAHHHDVQDHRKMDQHVQTAMAALRAKGNDHILGTTSWAQDGRHVVAVATCCLLPVDLDKLMQLVIESFQEDLELGIQLRPCNCEDGCICQPAVCAGISG